MLNRIVLVGRLTRDPELRRTASSDTPVASFTVAVDNKVKNPDGTKSTSFIPCVVWNQQADNVAKYCRKGSLVGVDGSLVQRSYNNKDGVKVTVFEVRCDSVQFLEPKSAAGEAAADDIAQPAPVDNSKNLDSIDVVDDDLPF